MDAGRLEQAVVTGAAAGGALLAFLASPILRFADPAHLAAAGCLLGVGVYGTWVSFVGGHGGHRAQRSSWWLLIAGVVYVVALSLHASAESSTNDGVCRQLQSRMLKGEDRGGDSASAFSALNCRPQYATMWERTLNTFRR